jgi:hypothetical protein
MSAKQDVDRVDVVVHDGVVASLVEVVEPFSAGAELEIFFP